MYSFVSSTYRWNWEGLHIHPEISLCLSRLCAIEEDDSHNMVRLVELFILMDESSHIAVPVDVNHSNSFANLFGYLDKVGHVGGK